MFHFKKSFFSFFIILTTLTFIGCDDGITNYTISEDELIGTWDLTKIIAYYPSGKKEKTSQEENLAITIIIDSNKTFQRYQNAQGQITNDSGTWSITNGELTVISASETFIFPCRINGNILQLGTKVKDPDSGIMLPITLEFKKQEIADSLKLNSTINKKETYNITGFFKSF